MNAAADKMRMKIGASSIESKADLELLMNINESLLIIRDELVELNRKVKE
jgi:hypothetical protein